MHRKPLRNTFAKFTMAVLEITVSHWTFVQPNFEKCHIMIGQDDRTSHQHIFFKVLLMNKLCLVKYLKCPTTRKIWKDTCPANKVKIISSNVIVTKIIFQVKVCDKILYETFISGNEVWNKLLTELKTQHCFEQWNLWIAIIYLA